MQILLTNCDFIFKMDYLNIPFPKTVPILVIDHETTETTASVTSTSSTSTPVTVNTQNFVTISHNKPRPYNGEKPQDWIKHFDMISIGNGWSKERKLQNIPPMFHDNLKGKNWYTLTYGSNPPSDYSEFCKKFISELAPANYDFYKYAQMNDRVQKIDEPCIDYYLAKMNLIKDYNDTMEEAMKVNIVVNGLREDHKRRVFGKWKTSSELFQALRNEDYLQKNESLHPVFALYPDNPPPPPYPTYNRNNYQQMYQNRPRFNNYQQTFRRPGTFRGQNRYRTNYHQRTMFYPQSNQQRTNPVVCYCCGTPGHIAKNCRLPRNPAATVRPSATAPDQVPKN